MVIVKSLIFRCRENDRKMTNRYPWAALSKIKGAFSEIPSLIVSIAQQQQRQQRKVLTMHWNHKKALCGVILFVFRLLESFQKGCFSDDVIWSLDCLSSFGNTKRTFTFKSNVNVGLTKTVESMKGYTRRWTRFFPTEAEVRNVPLSQLQLHVGLVSREICIKTDGGDDNSGTLLDTRQDPCSSNRMITGIFCSDTLVLLSISPVS